MHVFTETCIYEADEENEDLVEQWRESPESMVRAKSWQELVPLAKKHSPLFALDAFMRETNLTNARLDELMMNGVNYWAMELFFCSANGKGQVALSDIERMCRGKIFNFQFQHELYHELHGIERNDVEIELMTKLETLGEIVTDIVSYEKDVLKGSMNAYRNFVTLHGAQAFDGMKEFIDGQVDDFVALKRSVDETPRLDRVLQAEQDQFFAQVVSLIMEKSFTKEFEIPDPILDEQSFRERTMD